MTPCQLDLNPTTVQATLDACMAILGRPDSPANLSLGIAVAAAVGVALCLGLMAAAKVWGRRG